MSMAEQCAPPTHRTPVAPCLPPPPPTYTFCPFRLRSFPHDTHITSRTHFYSHTLLSCTSSPAVHLLRERAVYSLLFLLVCTQAVTLSVQERVLRPLLPPQREVRSPVDREPVRYNRQVTNAVQAQGAAARRHTGTMARRVVIAPPPKPSPLSVR